ncbi:MAG TPA: hypothetical protein VFK02_35045 [Kofleriaceae bacterium]|nr:hypothetical protein [Kofleriaceae bacterium]
MWTQRAAAGARPGAAGPGRRGSRRRARTGRATRRPGRDAGLRIGTARDEAHRRAVIEVAIEGPEIVAALAAGAALPIGLYRMEGQHKRQYLAAFPTRTPKPSFHVPEAFGTLVLDR